MRRLALLYVAACTTPSGVPADGGVTDASIRFDATVDVAADTATQPRNTMGFSPVTAYLFAMARPGARVPFEEDLAYLEGRVEVLVSLTPEPIDFDAVEARGIATAHIPVIDFQAPRPEQFDEFIAIVDEAREFGLRVGVHCTAGLGRSGTMGAGYLISQGLTTDDAIFLMRAIRPGSIETRSQEQALYELEHRLRLP